MESRAFAVGLQPHPATGEGGDVIQQRRGIGAVDGQDWPQRQLVDRAPGAAVANDLAIPLDDPQLLGRARGTSRDDDSRARQRIAAHLGWDALGAPVVAELSGGIRQKLNVVLAGLGDPDVLLLDEPNQGLALDSTRRFCELAWAWRDAGRAILVVAHTRDGFERVDRVVELGSSGDRVMVR